MIPDTHKQLIDALKSWGFEKTTDNHYDFVFGEWKFKQEYPSLELFFVKGLQGREYCLLNLRIWSEPSKSYIYHVDDFEFDTISELEFLFKRVPRANAVFVIMNQMKGEGR